MEAPAHLRLYLVRHGAVTPPRPGMYYGGCEVSLSAAGEAEARRAGEALRAAALEQVCASPLARARYGAECVAAPHRLPVRIEPDLREIARGRWVGLTPEEVRARFPGDLGAHAADPEHWRGHGGESLGDLRRRVLGVRDRLLRAGAGAAALVSHLHPTRILLADALGWPLTRLEELEVPTGSIAEIEYRAGRALLRRWPERP